jgi:hypothetical protein
VRLVALVWLIASVGGCGGPPTDSLEITVTAADPHVRPTAVTVSVFDDFGKIGRARIMPAPLPGALRLLLQRPRSARLRVAAVGEGSVRVLGGSTVFRPDMTVADVTLSRSIVDEDGDGVPDDIDDCPAIADPDQTRTAGKGVGDACLATDAGVTIGAADAGTDGGL